MRVINLTLKCFLRGPVLSFKLCLACPCDTERVEKVQVQSMKNALDDCNCFFYLANLEYMLYMIMYYYLHPVLAYCLIYLKFQCMLPPTQFWRPLNFVWIMLKCLILSTFKIFDREEKFLSLVIVAIQWFSELDKT